MELKQAKFETEEAKKAKQEHYDYNVSQKACLVSRIAKLEESITLISNLLDKSGSAALDLGLKEVLVKLKQIRNDLQIMLNMIEREILEFEKEMLEKE